MTFQPDPVRNEHRRRFEWARKALWVGHGFFVVALTATIYMAAVGSSDPLWPMVALDVVTAAMLAWGWYWEWTRANFEYETSAGIGWLFQGARTYSAPERMARFDAILFHNWAYSDINVERQALREVISRLGIEVSSGNLEARGKDADGLTVHGPLHSIVEYEDSRKLDVTGWELSLQILHRIAPPDVTEASESAQRQYLRDKGVLPLDVPSGTKHPQEPIA